MWHVDDSEISWILYESRWKWVNLMKSSLDCSFWRWLEREMSQHLLGIFPFFTQSTILKIIENLIKFDLTWKLMDPKQVVVICDNTKCNKPGTNLLKWSRCKMARYCSKNVKLQCGHFIKNNASILLKNKILIGKNTRTNSWTKFSRANIFPLFQK